MKNATKFLLLAGSLFMLADHGYGRECAMTPLNEMAGIFRSPGYPNVAYPNRVRCRYVIKARPMHFVRITFDGFELEPPKKGKRTDFVKIVDGEPGNPARIVYYNGTATAPFKYRSQTSRVVVILVTNRRVRKMGFSANYLQTEDSTKCHRSKIDNAREDCNELYSTCNISCVDGYQLEGSMQAECNTSYGTWTNLPQCVMVPSIADICLGDINKPDCPYNAEDLSDYFAENPANAKEEVLTLTAELGDGLVVFGEISVSATVHPKISSLNRFTCPKHIICEKNETTGTYQLSCPRHSQALKRKFKLNDEDTRRAMELCFRCRSNVCRRVRPLAVPSLRIRLTRQRTTTTTTTATTAEKKVTCPPYICLYDRNAGRFKYSCPVIAQALKEKHRLGDENDSDGTMLPMPEPRMFNDLDLSIISLIENNHDTKKAQRVD